MLDADGFAYVGYIVSLFDFELVVHFLPVVGYGEDAVSTCKSFGEGVFVIDVALCVERQID